MFELAVREKFSAAHHIRGYQGDCGRPHGHTWLVEVFVRTVRLDQLDMAMDFRIFKKALREVVGLWDHQDLNSLEDFKKTNPTAEQIAKIAFEKLSTLISDHGLTVDRVTVWESETTSATYFGESGA